MDRKIRQLERLAASGDIEAQHRLLRLSFKAGKLDMNRIFITDHNPHSEFVIAYRLQPYEDGASEDPIYRYHGRWIPDANEFIVERLAGIDLTGPVDLYLVYCEEVMGAARGGLINYDTEDTLYFPGNTIFNFYDEGSELASFLRKHFINPAYLINELEDGTIILRRPVVLQEINSRSLYHPDYYDKDAITYQEDPVTFPWQDITVVAKDPGEAPKIITLCNRFENFQLICNEGTLEYDMDYYWKNSSAKYHGGVETERIFDNVFMLVPEEPWGKEPNFNVFRPPALPRDHPRVMEMLKSGAISGDVESLFQPKIQTIMGTVAFVKMIHDGEEPDWDSLPWPWNEVAQEKEGYPVQLELQGLSDVDIDRVMEWILTAPHG